MPLKATPNNLLQCKLIEWKGRGESCGLFVWEDANGSALSDVARGTNQRHWQVQNARTGSGYRFSDRYPPGEVHIDRYALFAAMVARDVLD